MTGAEGTGRPRFTVSRAIVFDLDGTVVDSHLDLDGTRRALQSLVSQARRDRAGTASEDGTSTAAPSLSELLREAQALGPEEGQAATALVDAMEARALPVVMTGARAALRRLGRERDLGIGILTNSGRDGALGLLERLDIRPLFDVILCREDVPMLKPSPLGLRRMVEQLGNPGRTVYVGDSWIDARAAEEAGIPFVAFRLSEDRLRSRGLPTPMAHAADWAELDRLLRAWLTAPAGSLDVAT